MKIQLKVNKNKTEYSRIEKILQPLQMKVGWFENLSYDLDERGKQIKVATVAAHNEFGYENIPPRPFMRPARDNNKGKWLSTFRKLIKNGDVKNALDVLGLLVAGDIRQAIVNVQTPPLAPATIKARKKHYRGQTFESSIEKPLIDTGLMISSVSHKTEVVR